MNAVQVEVSVLGPPVVPLLLLDCQDTGRLQPYASPEVSLKMSRFLQPSECYKELEKKKEVHCFKVKTFSSLMLGGMRLLLWR
jgi:hypothetical protein